MAKSKNDVIVEQVFSPVEDTKIKSNSKIIGNSKIWDLCFKEEEVNDELLMKHPKMFKYTIKFEGLTPIQVTKVKKIK